MRKNTFCYLYPLALLLAPLSGQAVQILYTAESDSGASVNDSLTADGRQNGTVTGSITVASAEPRFGSRCYQFGNQVTAPSETRIELAGTANLDLGKTYTLAAAVKLRTAPQGNIYIRLFHDYAGKGEVKNFLLDFHPASGKFRFYNGDGTSLSKSVGAISLGSWHHFAVTYDNGATKLYFDGNLVHSANTAVTGTATTVSPAGLYFGEDLPAGSENNTLDGFADDILVYHRALSAADISNLYNKGAQAVDLL